MIVNNIEIYGHVSAYMYEGTELIQSIEQPNLIVDVGKNALAKRIAFVAEPEIRQIAIGTGSNTALFSQTELQSQTAIRNTQFTQIDENNIATFITSFPEGIGTGDIREVGLFDAADTMISRTVFGTPFNKQPTRFLNITWRLQVA